MEKMHGRDVWKRCMEEIYEEMYEEIYGRDAWRRCVAFNNPVIQNVEALSNMSQDSQPRSRNTCDASRTIVRSVGRGRSVLSKLTQVFFAENPIRINVPGATELTVAASSGDYWRCHGGSALGSRDWREDASEYEKVSGKTDGGGSFRWEPKSKLI